MHLQRDLTAAANKKENLNWAQWAGAVPALVAVPVGAVQGFASRDWALCGAQIFYGIAITAILLAFNRPVRRVEMPLTHTFQPFVPPERMANPWPRPALVQRVGSLLSAPEPERARIVVIAGESGAGKSVLVKRLLAGAGRTTYVDSYPESFPDRLASQAAAGEPGIVILDQFEQFLARRRDRPEGRTELVEAFRRHGAVFVLVVRSEWVYELRFLGADAPKLDEIVDVRALSALQDTPISRAIEHSLADVLDDKDAAQSILADVMSQGGILPLEVQIIGSVIEGARDGGERIGARWFREEMGGPRGAIDAYFEHLLAGSPNRRVALKVLCALSFRTQYRNRVSKADLLDVLFEDEQVADGVLGHLSYHHVVIEKNAGYILAHDYLAMYFNRLTALELDASDRENILYAMQNRLPGTSVRSPAVKSRKERRPNQTSRFARVMVFTVLAAMTVRLLLAADWWIPDSRFGAVRPLFPKGLVDANYLPIYIAHLVWAIYVLLYYERILAYIRQRDRGRWFSALVVTNMILLLLVTMFFPAIWVLSIGWGGIVVGVQALLLGRRKDINLAARRRLSDFGLGTVINTIIMFAFGALVAAAVVSYGLSDSAPDLVYFGSVGTSFVLTLVGLTLGNKHVSAEGSSRLLGLLSRHQTSTPLRVSAL